MQEFHPLLQTHLQHRKDFKEEVVFKRDPSKFYQDMDLHNLRQPKLVRKI